MCPCAEQLSRSSFGGRNGQARRMNKPSASQETLPDGCSSQTTFGFIVCKEDSGYQVTENCRDNCALVSESLEKAQRKARADAL